MSERDTVRLEVPSDADGARLDRFLADHVAGHTRSAVRRWIVDGHVTVDGSKPSKPGLSLAPGMRVEVVIPEPEPGTPLPESVPLEIVHEDDDLVVVVKPAGMVVHPGHGRSSGTLVNALLGRGTALSRVGGPRRPGIVHRLDRETSGLLIVAKNDRSHHALSRAFAEREIEKTYRVLVWGHPDPGEGTIERAIGRSRGDRTRMSVHVRGGRAARTHYRTLRRLPGFTLLDVDLETGRTHQVRVHMQSIHHPVVGDTRYGGRMWKGVQDPTQRKALRTFDRLALHAFALRFRHPTTGMSQRFESPLPAEFENLLAVLEHDA
ncbi:MAG: RluA family pseudouridine synthase [Acidobacteriota bacterium]|nr:RluA family pseudouridine synthase [Acidobacteriota bacterium]